MKAPVVTLSSDSPAVVPPRTVFVKGGAASATFQVFTLQVGEATTGVVTASGNGEASASLTVTAR